MRQEWTVNVEIGGGIAQTFSRSFEKTPLKGGTTEIRWGNKDPLVKDGTYRIKEISSTEYNTMTIVPVHGLA